MQDGGEGLVINLHNLFGENVGKRLSLQVTARELHAERKNEKKKKPKTKQPNIKIKSVLHDLDTAEEHNTE